MFNYYRAKRVSIKQFYYFEAFLWLVLLNFISEFVTLYTINHYDSIYPFYNRLAHQVFIGSMDFVIFFLYIYVDSKRRAQKKYTRLEYFLRCVPLIVSFIMVIFGKLYYNLDGAVKYSYGPIVYTVYLSMIIYFGAIIWCVFHSRGNISRNEQIALFTGFVIAVVLSVLQYFIPELLISSLGLALLVFLLYISIENPREYYDQSLDDAMNQRAFRQVIEDKLAREEKFYVVSATLESASQILDALGQTEKNSVLKKGVQFLNHRLKKVVYHAEENTLAIIMPLNGEIDRIRNADIKKQDFFVKTGIYFQPKYSFGIIECPTYAHSLEELLSLMDFIPLSRKREESDIVEVDDSVLKEKQYLWSVENILRKAVTEDGLDIFYQPIYDTSNKAFVSAEALVRLKDTSTLGFVSPEVFIPIAEHIGLINQLGEIVFRKVCEFSSANHLWEKGVKFVEVNISGIQSVDPMLPQTLERYMEQYGISPRFINLEITETVSVEIGDLFKENLLQLRSLGCNFSMDDFGTGYSNIAKMADTKFEIIKLDKSLLWSCFDEKNPKKAQSAIVILMSCIRMIHNLDLTIVAEGVETKEQAEILISNNVRHLQGYYFSRPINETSYLDFLEAHSN